MHDQKIHGWTACRSGAAMTVKGTDPEGQQVKVSNVSLIGPDKLGNIIATTRNVGGPRYQLLPALEA
jgi:hypothetical protein